MITLTIQNLNLKNFCEKYVKKFGGDPIALFNKLSDILNNNTVIDFLKNVNDFEYSQLIWINTGLIGINTYVDILKGENVNTIGVGMFSKVEGNLYKRKRSVQLFSINTVGVVQHGLTLKESSINPPGTFNKNIIYFSVIGLLGLLLIIGKK